MKALYVSLLALSIAVTGYLFAFRLFNQGDYVQSQVLASTVTVVEQKENDIIYQINAVRREAGLSEVTYDFGLKDLSSMRVADMIDNEYYSHTTPQGYTYGNFMGKYSPGSSFSCENLQLQAGSDENSVVDAWVKSPAHYRCLTNPRVTKVAVSYGVYSDVTRTHSESSDEMYIFAMIAAN
jgi:uncharacterized protein YkwD